jgi:TonB family protein
MLQRSEIEALSAATRGDPKALAKSPRHKWPDRTRREPENSVSTVDGFPRGFVAGVLEAAGCDPRGAHGVAAAQAAYGPDGRPRQMAMADPGQSRALGGPPACEEAARVMLVSALRGNSRPAPPKTLLVLLNAEALTCLAEGPPAQPPEASPDESEGGPPTKNGIQEPRKLRNVSPEYPSSAHELKIEGVVVLEAVISPTGCVRSLDVVRGIPTLNWEAMRAVSQWRYTPTLLNGKPVPVIMTVTVNFKLGRR